MLRARRGLAGVAAWTVGSAVEREALMPRHPL
jgi:hypothetical protein